MATAIPYPVTYEVVPFIAGHNRLTSLVRLILAIPHHLVIYVLGQVAQLMALICWVAVIFTGKMPKGMWDFIVSYLTWKARVTAYSSLHCDEYPPFTFDPYEYPARFIPGEFPEARNRLTVFLRILLAIPHVIVLAFIAIAVFITSFIGWLAVVITGTYPEGLYNFSVGFTRWATRLEAYTLLLTDEYPPFSMT